MTDPTPLALSRTLKQRMAALKRANAIRTHRRILKEDIAKGLVDAIPIIRDPYSEVLTMKVWDLLLAIPGVGKVKTNAALRRCSVSTSKTLGGLSDRQRDELVDDPDVHSRAGIVAMRQAA